MFPLNFNGDYVKKNSSETLRHAEKTPHWEDNISMYPRDQ